MHKLLARQLRHHFGSPDNVPLELRSFANDVERAYVQSDDDRAMLEHSMETVSDELVERFTAGRHLEEQLRQSQKMEAVGTLAGGVAHDFNNLLTVIRGHAELVIEVLGAPHAARADLDGITKAVERAGALTRQLLAFSRKQVLQPVTLDLNEVVTSLMIMVRRLIGEDIEVTIEPSPALGLVTADPGQMEQIVVNLVVNARDAMPRGGHIRIRTENVALNQSDEYERANGLPSGEFVLLVVSDTGPGIAPAHRDRIFEPFFTTKGVGKGTGLGLSTVFGIVKQSGGHLILDSETGRGATFKIYLPRSAPCSVLRPAGLTVSQRTTGTETILVAEDEDAVRGLVLRMLRGRGYNVLAARDDAEAMALAAKHAGSIGLLLTDVIMPGMGGAKLSARSQQFSPGIRVLYMSGYAVDNIDRQCMVAEGSNLVQKPFSGAGLALAVRAALDKPAEGVPEAA